MSAPALAQGERASAPAQLSVQPPRVGIVLSHSVALAAAGVDSDGNTRGDRAGHALSVSLSPLALAGGAFLLLDNHRHGGESLGALEGGAATGLATVILKRGINETRPNGGGGLLSLGPRLAGLLDGDRSDHVSSQIQVARLRHGHRDCRRPGSAYQGVPKGEELDFELMKLVCPRCQSEHRQIKAGLNRSRSQRYQCLGCRKLYTPHRKSQGHAGEVRQQAVRYTLEGLSQRKVARLLGVSPQSVANWLALASATLQAQHGSEVPSAVAVPGDEVVEMDELYTFCGAKRGKKQVPRPAPALHHDLRDITTFVSRKTRCIVAWDVMDQRTYDTVQPLLDQALERLPQAKQFYEVAQSAPLLAAGMNRLEEGTDSMSVSSWEVLEVGGDSMPPSTSGRGR